MSNYFDRPDGEHFTDTTEKPIPAAEHWHGLSINQLIEVKNVLMSRQLFFRNKPEIQKPLAQGIARLDALIEQRLSAP
jgi:hypothetical protein